MAVTAYKPLQTDSIELTRLQQRVSSTLDTITDKILLNGRLIANVALTTSTQLIEHGLQRDFRGWLVVRSNANATVYEGTFSGPASISDRIIPLKASAAVTVSLWVF